MDLRISYPRSVKEKLSGYVHLGRMIDKCRATLAGTLGEYIYPCPMDQRLLDFVGISADEFQDAVRDRTDEAVVAWFHDHAQPHTQAEIDAWNEMMLTRGPDTKEKWEYFRQLRDAVDPTRTDITSWADLLDLDERRPVPIRSATTTGGRR